MGSNRKPREQTFLDDPAAYPEYSLLIKRRRLQHAFRWRLHRHRTAALVVLVALSISASGAVMPEIPFVGGGGEGGTAEEWVAYLAKGINTPLLGKHFEGIASALACMLVCCLITLLTYPIYKMGENNPATAAPSRRPSVAVRILAVAAPSAAVWAVAVCAAGVFRWGVASGLCVGLQCAALTLKSVSFVQQTRPAGAAAAVAAAPSGAAAAMTSGSSEDSDGQTITILAHSGGPGAIGEDKPGAQSAEMSKNGGDGAATLQKGETRGGETCAASSAPTLQASKTKTAAAAASATLDFAEFAFFLLLVPSLVCEPPLLAAAARRPWRAARAASEFLHAGLTYLAVHAACSSFFAPALRVLAAALHADCGGEGGGWADGKGWAELSSGTGSGWWLPLLHDRGACYASWSEEGESGVGAGGDGGGAGCGGAGSSLEWLGRQGFTVAAAAGLGIFVLSPMMHFLMFYAFFHSVCLGCAELWGYPDRNIYGPWWLVVDDVRDYFRLWSAPVHRWLSSSIQRPMIEAGQREALRHRRRRRRCREGLLSDNGHGNGNGNGHGNVNGAAYEGPKQKKGETSLTSADGSDGSHGGGGRSDGGGGGGIITRWWISSVVCSFLVSGLVHEAVAFVAMRRTFWPFNTLFLALSASMTPFWDALFPVIAPTTSASASAADAGIGGSQAAGRNETLSAAATVAAPVAVSDSPKLGVGERRQEERPSEGAEGGEPSPRVASRPRMGSSRGRIAVVFYAVASLPLTLTVDYLVWQWWRHTHSAD